jgi:hypothetical protein
MLTSARLRNLPPEGPLTGWKAGAMRGVGRWLVCRSRSRLARASACFSCGEYGRDIRVGRVAGSDGCDHVRRLGRHCRPTRCVANAAGTCVGVELRPSVVIVRFPGGLPESVTVENIRKASAARNRASGRGSTSSSAATRCADLTGSPSSTPPEASALTNKQLRERLPVDSDEAREILHRLRDEGFLEQRGQRGGATYRLTGTLRPPSGLPLSLDELDAVVLSAAKRCSNAIALGTQYPAWVTPISATWLLIHIGRGGIASRTPG